MASNNYAAAQAAEEARAAAAARAREEAEKRAEEARIKAEEEAKKRAEEAAAKRKEEAAAKAKAEAAKKAAAEKAKSKQNIQKTTAKEFYNTPGVKGQGKDKDKSSDKTSRDKGKNIKRTDLLKQPHSLRDAKTYLHDEDKEGDTKAEQKAIGGITNKEAKDFLQHPGGQTKDYEEIKKLIDRGVAPNKLQSVLSHIFPSEQSIENKEQDTQKLMQALGGQAPSTPGAPGVSASATGTAKQAAASVNPTNTQQWATDILQQINADRAAKGQSQIPLTQGNILAMTAFANSEGSDATNNPFDTTQTAPGSTPLAGNTAGVQNYPTAQEGIQQAANTFLNGDYSPIINSLLAGNQSANNPNNLGYALAQTPWVNGWALGGGNDTTTIESDLSSGTATPDAVNSAGAYSPAATSTAEAGGSSQAATDQSLAAQAASSAASSPSASSDASVTPSTDLPSTASYSNPFSSLPTIGSGITTPSSTNPLLYQTLQSNSGSYQEPGVVNNQGSSSGTGDQSQQAMYQQLLALLPKIAPGAASNG